MSVSDSVLRPAWLKLPWGCGAPGAPGQRRKTWLAGASSRRFDRLRWREPAEPALRLTGPLAPPTAVTHSLPRQLALAPPWLLSLAVHLIALVLMALCVVAMPRGPATHVLILAPSDQAPAAPLAEQLTLELEALPPLGDLEPFIPLPAGDTLPQDVTVHLDAAADSSTIGQASLAGMFDSLVASSGAGNEVNEDSPSAQFFDIEARGRTFVFVVDSSNSMRLGKLDAAKDELLYAIRRLSSDQSFYVIFFNGNTVPMSFDPSGEPEPAPVAATNENLQKLESWVDTVDVDPWTDPCDALRQAVGMLPDAIYLLSDGRFTDRGETIRFLKQENYVREAGKRRPKVIIHTVGLHQRDGEATLKSIARAYGGTYRFVPPPK